MTMRNNLNNKILYFLVFDILLLFLFSSFNLTNAQKMNTTPLKIGFDLWVPNFLAYVAQEKGIFKKNNLDVNLTLIEDHTNELNAYSNGDLDGTFMIYSDAIIQHSYGIDTNVVYNVDYSYKADAIVGNGNSLSDIKGKKIGVDGINSYSHFFVLKSLEKYGLSEGDVEFVDVPVQNVTSALQKGQIIAGHTYEPFISDALKKGFKILSTSADDPGIITTALVFHSDIINHRSQDIQNFIKSMAEAKEDYKRNKNQDISIMALKSGFNAENITEGMDKAILLDLNYNIKNSFNKTSNQATSLYKTGNDIERFYAERGVISDYFNIDDLLDPQFLNAVITETSKE
jgi:NitT/TauT family transport system substrate-binding protein